VKSRNLHCGFAGGNKGVQLVLKNGKKILIGSQRAEELKKAIRSIMT
jgi:hypothetical protein